MKTVIVKRDDRRVASYAGRQSMQRASRSLPFWRDSYMHDVTRCTGAERERAAAHTGLCVFIGKRLRPEFGADEIVSFAFPAVLKALRSHDPTHAAESTWVAHAVRACFAKHKTREGFFARSHEFRHLKAKAAPLLFGGRSHLHVTADPDATTGSETADGLRDKLRSALAALSPRSRDMLASHLGLNGPPVTQRELVARYKLSKVRVSQIVRRALEDVAEMCGLKLVIKPRNSH